MPENLPNNSETDTREQARSEYVLLGKELSERTERLVFPGIKESSYAEMKANEGLYLGRITPIDDLIGMFETRGMKVVLGDDPENGYVYILPVGSDDIRGESILPRHLLLTEDMDSELKRLIEMNSRDRPLTK